MERKKIQLSIIAIALLFAVSAALFLYTRSTEFSASREKGQVAEQASRARAAQNDSGWNGTLRRHIGLNTVGNASAGGGSGNGTPEASRYRTDVKEPQKTRAPKEKVVTPAFVLDVADFVASRYHPEWGLDNPRKKGMLRLSFRALNARYGTELIGLRHSSSGLKEAREEVLDHLMVPRVLDRVYSRFGDSFVRTLVRDGRESTRRVKSPAGEVRERRLSDGDVAEMLRLSGSYLRDVSVVFTVLGKNPGLEALIKDYLQAKSRGVHVTYRLSRVEEELERRRERSGEEVPEELRKKRRTLAERYSQAIAEREKARQELIDRVMKRAGDEVELDVAEILYIAEWVHRRLPGEKRRPAILKGGQLLMDLADKLDRRAETLESG
jgi:type II secretory pathway pseudopilin PulG